MERSTRRESTTNHYRKQMFLSLMNDILREEVRQQVEHYCQRLPSMIMHDYFFATKRPSGPSTSTEPNCRTAVTTDGKFKIKIDTANFAMNELLVRPINGQLVITGKHYVSKKDCYEFFEMKRTFDIPENVDINTARGYRNHKGILMIEASFKSAPGDRKVIRIDPMPDNRHARLTKRPKSSEWVRKNFIEERNSVPGASGRSYSSASQKEEAASAMESRRESKHTTTRDHQNIPHLFRNGKSLIAPKPVKPASPKKDSSTMTSSVGLAPPSSSDGAVFLTSCQKTESLVETPGEEFSSEEQQSNPSMSKNERPCAPSTLREESVSPVSPKGQKHVPLSSPNECERSAFQPYKGSSGKRVRTRDSSTSPCTHEHSSFESQTKKAKTSSLATSDPSNEKLRESNLSTTKKEVVPSESEKQETKEFECTAAIKKESTPSSPSDDSETPLESATVNPEKITETEERIASECPENDGSTSLSLLEKCSETCTLCTPPNQHIASLSADKKAEPPCSQLSSSVKIESSILTSSEEEMESTVSPSAERKEQISSACLPIDKKGKDPVPRQGRESPSPIEKEESVFSSSTNKEEESTFPLSIPMEEESAPSLQTNEETSASASKKDEKSEF